ncbi:MAG: putative toxin-antitoxin system toxin component, PIN family [Hyphomicrobium sp.]
MIFDLAVRIVLDTSVLAAALRSRLGASRLWVGSVLKGEHTALLSVPVVVEYEAVLTRTEQLQASGLSAVQVCRFLDGLCSVAEHVDIANLWRPLLRDPDDEMVLETAAQGGAELLLTFNVRDLRQAGTFGITVSQPGPAWRQAVGG